MKTVAPVAHPIAAPATERLMPGEGGQGLDVQQRPELRLVGNLLWWRFWDTATDLADLARVALEVNYPTLFLPVPHPISSSVALWRALQRATANVPAGHGRWRADSVGVEGLMRRQSPEAFRVWSRSYDPRPLLGVVLRWEPDREPLERPWHVHLWVGLRCDAGAEHLPLYDRLRIFMEVYLGAVRLEVEVTDSVVKIVADLKAMDQEVMNIRAQHKTDLQKSLPEEEERRLVEALRLDLWMGERIYSRLDEELYAATAPEIGDGVMAALEDVGGVKLRPGLFTVPGQAGIARAEATEKYLRQVGRTEAGRFDLYAPAAERAGTAGLVLSELKAEVRALHAEASRLDPQTIGTRALRTRWLALDGLESRLRSNEPFLGKAVAGLLDLLEEARRELRRKAESRELALEPGATAVAGLRTALETLHDVARDQDWAELHRGEDLLKPHQETARRLGVGDLLRRLRKLTAATLHVREESFRGGEDQARRRTRVLCDALAAAAADLRARLPERKGARA